MRDGNTVSVIIPAYNEALSIGHVIDDIPEWVDEVIVVDNASTDNTAGVAAGHGASVLSEPRQGYGYACLKGMSHLNNPDIVVFLDGDYSDYPSEMSCLVDPIIDGRADMVIGSRVIGKIDRGALTPQQRFGNTLACFLMRVFWGVRFTDLGPFRAIRYDSLLSLDMNDKTYGWTVEMQIKAARQHLRCLDVPIGYRKRIGKSKISGTVSGVIKAGTKILSTIFLAAFDTWRSRN